VRRHFDFKSCVQSPSVRYDKRVRRQKNDLPRCGAAAALLGRRAGRALPSECQKTCQPRESVPKDFPSRKVEPPKRDCAGLVRPSPRRAGPAPRCQDVRYDGFESHALNRGVLRAAVCAQFPCVGGTKTARTINGFADQLINRTVTGCFAPRKTSDPREKDPPYESEGSQAAPIPCEHTKEASASACKSGQEGTNLRTPAGKIPQASLLARKAPSAP